MNISNAKIYFMALTIPLCFKYKYLGKLSEIYAHNKKVKRFHSEFFFIFFYEIQRIKQNKKLKFLSISLPIFYFL